MVSHCVGMAACTFLYKNIIKLNKLNSLIVKFEFMK